jgi:hypothetical protein
MSTRSRIAITKAGGFRSVYCHSDGYPKGPCGIGFTLLTHYAEREKVEQLMTLGHLSVLGPEIGRTHNGKQRMREVATMRRYSNWCLAYSRDCGEKDVRADEHATFDELVQAADDTTAEYLYVLFDEVWLSAPLKPGLCLDDLLPLTPEVVAEEVKARAFYVKPAGARRLLEFIREHGLDEETKQSDDERFDRCIVLRSQVAVARAAVRYLSRCRCAHRIEMV